MYGAVWDIVDYVCIVVGCEFVVVIDNLVVIFDGWVELNGNFYGVLVGYVLDFFVIVVVDVASMSEWCIDWFFDKVCN